MLSVANRTHALFVAYLFQIPLKDSGDLPIGPSTEELYTGLAVLFAYVFLDRDPMQSFQLKANAKEVARKLSQAIRLSVQSVKIGKHLRFNHLLNESTGQQLLSGYGRKMIERLLDHGKSVDDIVAEILPTITGAVALQAQAMVQMLDLYLQEKHQGHWEEIRRCAYSKDLNDFETLQKYALEACRLAPAATAVLRQTASHGRIQDGDTTIEYEREEMIQLDFVSAGRDPAKFSPHADEIDVSRDLDSYIHHGMGRHSCLGEPIVRISLAVQLGEFAKLKNLRRLPGPAGRLQYTTEFPGMLDSGRLYMTEDQSNWSPYPTSKCRLRQTSSFSPSPLSFFFPLFLFFLPILPTVERAFEAKKLTQPCSVPLAWKIQHQGFCPELEDHELYAMQERRTDTLDSGIGICDTLEQHGPYLAQEEDIDKIDCGIGDRETLEQHRPDPARKEGTDKSGNATSFSGASPDFACRGSSSSVKSFQETSIGPA